MFIELSFAISAKQGQENLGKYEVKRVGSRLFRQMNWNTGIHVSTFTLPLKSPFPTKKLSLKTYLTFVQEVWWFSVLFDTESPHLLTDNAPELLLTTYEGQI